MAPEAVTEFIDPDYEYAQDRAGYRDEEEEHPE